MNRSIFALLASVALGACGTTAAIVPQVAPPSGGANHAYGFGYYTFDDSRWGGFLDIRATLDSRAPTVDAAAPGDTPLQSELDVGVGNIGMTYLIGYDHLELKWGIGAFAGAGYAEFIPTVDYGSYWVEGSKDGGFNLNLGLTAWIHRVVFTVGYDSFLERPSFGIGYRL